MADYHETTMDLIRQIERKDQRFRMFQAISVTIIGILIIILLLINIQSQQQNHKLLAQNVKIVNQLRSNSKQRTKQINDLQHHIDCIIDLFQIPNRTTFYITDPTTCHIENTNTSFTPSSDNSEPAQSTPVTNNPTPVSQPAANQPQNPPQQSSQPKPNIIQRIDNFIRSL